MLGCIAYLLAAIIVLKSLNTHVSADVSAGDRAPSLLDLLLERSLTYPAYGTEGYRRVCKKKLM
jgi:hypothetical protein